MTTLATDIRTPSHVLANTANQAIIYADLLQAPLAQHISRNPHLLRLVEEAFGQIRVTPKTTVLEHDMGRQVGYVEHIATTPQDTVFYAQTTKTAGFTPFTKSRASAGTQFITMVVSHLEDDAYELVDVWLGKFYPAIPNEVEATAESLEYWSNHAVVFNGQTLITSTLTKTCPYVTPES